MLAVTGLRTTIVQELARIVPDEVKRLPGVLNTFNANAACMGLIRAERYVLAAGFLQPRRIGDQTEGEIETSLAVNLVSAVQLCERILQTNETARICVIGSESGIKGSYDTTYALCKAALHRYVETKAIGPQQQLVCVAPSVIEDSGMTWRRQDLIEVKRNAVLLPKQRLLKAVEVARLVHFLLYVDEGYITNTVVRIDGGKSATA